MRTTTIVVTRVQQNAALLLSVEDGFCNEELLDNALKDAGGHVYVIREGGHIVATGTLCISHTLEFTIADIESVVVGAQYRGRGYGKELMEALVEAAKGFKAHHIQLTSKPARWRRTACISSLVSSARKPMRM